MLALGCERILCLCEASSETTLLVQRLAEAAGAEFHAIKGVTQIAALARPQDEIVMLRDGLLVDPCVLERGNSGGEGAIFTISASHPLAEAYPDDFERIDRERHWAGFAMFPASRMAELAEYPSDSEAMSLLLRLGLQAQTRCRALGEVLDESALRSRQWLLASDGDVLEEHQASLVAGNLPSGSWLGPGAMLARLGVKMAAPLGIEIGHTLSAGAAFVLSLGSIGLLALNFPATGLAVAALGAFLAEISAKMSALRRALFTRDDPSILDRVLAPAMAVLSTVAIVLAVFLNGREIALVATALISMGLAYHLAGAPSARMRAFFGDRTLHFALFAIAASFGLLVEAIALFGVLALAQLMLHGRQH